LTTVLSRPSSAPTPPSGQPSTLAPRGGVLGPSIATAIAVLLTSWSLAPLVDTGGWLGATMLVVLVVTVVGGVATWARVPVFLIPILQALALFSALVGRFVPDAPLGIVPSPDALTSLRATLADGMTSVDQFAPPIPLSEGVSAVIALGLGCVAIVVFVLSVNLRMPVAAGAGLVAVYVVPSLVLDDGSPWWAFTAVALGWMVLLVSDERVGLVTWGRLLRRADTSGPRSPLAGLSSGAFRLGGLAVVVSILLPILVPSLADAVLGRSDTGSGAPGTGGAGPLGAVGLDPFVSLRRDLVSQPDTVVLHYTTTATTPTYLPTVVLEDYANERWQARAFSTDGSAQVQDGLPVSPSTVPSATATVRHYTMTVDALVNKYLPVPEGLTSLSSLPGDWFIDGGSGTIFAGPGTSTRGASWQADAVEGTPSPAQLQAAQAVTAPDNEAARNASVVPPALATTAQQVTAGKTTNYERALALQQWFLDNFTYSTDVKSDQSASYLEQFLNDRKGYCQQFAATMALMARSLGIPARVVVGYTQGSLSSDSHTWVVKAKDAHAWPELSFPGLGWVRFEPTPRGAAQGGTVSIPTYATPGVVPTGTPSSQPSSSSSSTGPGGKLGTLTERENRGAVPFDGPAVDTATTPDQWRLRGLVALVLVVLAGLAVPAVRRLLRRRRRLSATAGVEDAWDELRDTARDLGLPWSDSLTPRQAVASVITRERLQGKVAEAATRVGRTTERARYAPTPPSTQGLSEDVSAVRTALLDRVDRPTRIRALLLPASLRRRPPE